MTRRNLAPVVGVLAGAALLVAAGPAAARTVHGTVVHKNSRAHAFVVAARSGKLTKLYSSRSPAVGRSVSAQVHGSKATRVKAGARQRRAKLRGTVTYVDRKRGRFAVSAAGSSILVKLRHRGARGASDQLPPVGNQVIVVTGFDNTGELEAEQVDDMGEDQGEFEVEGIVKSIDTTNHQIVISAEDDDQASGDVTVQLPASFDFSQIHQGDQIQLHLVRQADGTFLVRESEIEGGDGPGDGGNHSGSGGDSHGDGGGSGD